MTTQIHQNSPDETDRETVRRIVAEMAAMPGALLPILHEVQHRLGHVPDDTVAVIAQGLNLSRAEVHGVISFYHHFRSAPAGKHVVQVCRAEACQAVGARELEAHAQHSLAIETGATTTDGKVTLEPVYCLGNCACGPSVQVDDKIYARVTAERFDALMASLEIG